MKKIFLMFSVFVILFFSSAIADPDYIGAWATIHDLNDTESEIIILRIYPENVVYFSSRKISPSNIGEETKGLYTWDYIDDRSFFLYNDSNENLGKFGMINNKRLMTTNDVFASLTITTPLDEFDYYVKPTQTPYSTPEPDPTPEPPKCLTVPSGVYIAGEDFPAGTYRIEMEDESNTGVIVLYENMEDTKRAFSYLHEYSMTKKSPVVGKMVIEPGNVLDVRNTIIILLPYEGLK